MYNLASGATYSIGSILEMFRAFTPVRFEIQVSPSRQRPGQRQRISADPAKLKADTGWQPKIPVKTMLCDLLGYWRSVQEKAVVSVHRADH